MPLSSQFLDEVRARTVLSALIGGSVALKRSGGELQGLCPFHAEQTPSFTVSDAKQFYHCFGCGAHGDAIRWLVDSQGLPFIDAVKELAASAGLEMPPRSLAEAARGDAAARLLPLLARAADWYSVQLEAAGAAREYLLARGVEEAACATFGLGWAPGGRVSVREVLTGASDADLVAAGLLRDHDGRLRDFLWSRVVIPVRDARGRVVGFAGRGLGDVKPKYVNSPDGPVFDKGRLLFNLDRAASRFRQPATAGAGARSTRRLVVIEGQFDAMSLDRAGVAAVAPMGTALTEAQLGRAWGVANVPILLFDGDPAGRAAAVRACERAMPGIGPGTSLKIALCPAGSDPDRLAREGGADAVEAVLADARPIDEFLFDAVMAARA